MKQSQTAAALPGCSLVFGISIPETQFYLLAPRRDSSAPLQNPALWAGFFASRRFRRGAHSLYGSSPLERNGSRGPLFCLFRACMSCGKPADCGDGRNRRPLLTCTASGTR